MGYCAATARAFRTRWGAPESEREYTDKFVGLTDPPSAVWEDSFTWPIAELTGIAPANIKPAATGSGARKAAPAAAAAAGPEKAPAKPTTARIFWRGKTLADEDVLVQSRRDRQMLGAIFVDKRQILQVPFATFPSEDHCGDFLTKLAQELCQGTLTPENLKQARDDRLKDLGLARPMRGKRAAAAEGAAPPCLKRPAAPPQATTPPPEPAAPPPPPGQAAPTAGPPTRPLVRRTSAASSTGLMEPPPPSFEEDLEVLMIGLQPLDAEW